MLNFGELPFNLTYWDSPNEEDDIDDQIKLPHGSFMIRLFDQLSFDSIHYFLGVGGQPVILIYENNIILDHKTFDSYKARVAGNKTRIGVRRI